MIKVLQQSHNKPLEEMMRLTIVHELGGKFGNTLNLFDDSSLLIDEFSFQADDNYTPEIATAHYAGWTCEKDGTLAPYLNWAYPDGFYIVSSDTPPEWCEEYNARMMAWLTFHDQLPPEVKLDLAEDRNAQLEKQVDRLTAQVLRMTSALAPFVLQYRALNQFTDDRTLLYKLTNFITLDIGDLREAAEAIEDYEHDHRRAFHV